jgi:YD repeat-containing protein
LTLATAQRLAPFLTSGAVRPVPILTLMLGLLGGILSSPKTYADTAPYISSVTAVPASQGSITLSWAFSYTGPNVTSIAILRCDHTHSACTDQSGYTQAIYLNFLNSPLVGFATDTGLTASTEYHYEVIATNSIGQSNIGGAIASTVAFPAPTNLTAVPTSGSSVMLQWTDPSTDLASFNLYQCSSSGCTDFALVESVPVSGNLLLGQGAGNAARTGLTPQGTYRFRVTALDGVNTSAPTDPITVTLPPVDTTPPTTPADLIATTASPTEIDVSWGASTDDLYLSAYDLERCAGTGCTNFVSISGTHESTYTDIGGGPGLLPSTTYRYEVFALDGSQNRSAVSNIATATTLPGTPTALTASNVTSMGVTLSWTYPGTSAGLAGYLVEQCQGAGCTSFTQVATVTNTSDLITGLTPRTTYQFRVRSAAPSGDDSGYSNVVTVNTLPIAPPTALAATSRSDSQITLTWTASTAPNVTAYLIERCAGAACTNFVQIGSTTASSFYDGGELPVTAYQYRVRAQDASGNLSDYATIGATTAALASPTGLAASVASTSQINLSWLASPSTGVTTYLIERCSSSACSNFTQIATTAGTTYSDTGLASATTYSYRVRATDPAGDLSPYTSQVTVSTLALTPATSLTGTPLSSSQVSLSWSASTASGTTAYVVQRCNGRGCNWFSMITTLTSTSFTDSGLCASTSYSYRVQAIGSAGEISAESNVVSVTTASASGSGNSGCGSTSGGGPGGSSGPTSAYIYDTSGHLTSVTVNGVTTSYHYDAAGHVTSIQTGN